MTIPTPGQPARGSRSGRPIMVLLDLLGRRTALRILWELSLAGGPLTFRGLQAAAETNPNVLNARLKELRGAGLVDHGTEGYRLSGGGTALLAVVLPLNKWADDWAATREFSSDLPEGG
ncbi:MAG: helix-turn-helix transcriptional regulator [Rhizobiales bacterium]|nr:helix-turn-helix transcriptional regulator [Hyphomicrobiales bacterium]